MKIDWRWEWEVLRETFWDDRAIRYVTFAAALLFVALVLSGGMNWWVFFISAAVTFVLCRFMRL